MLLSEMISFDAPNVTLFEHQLVGNLPSALYCERLGLALLRTESVVDPGAGERAQPRRPLQ